MTSMSDPYKLLGVEATATASEARKAFRKAALRYHPDLFEGELADAEAAFRQLVDAYRQVLADIAQRRAVQAPAMSPQELAALADQPAQWDFHSVRAVDRLFRPGQEPSGAMMRSVPTMNEPAVFKWIWAAAMAAGLVPAIILAQRWAGDSTGFERVGIAMAAVLAAYVGILLAGLCVLVLSRNIVYLVARLSHRKALPAPLRLPRNRILRLFWPKE